MHFLIFSIICSVSVGIIFKLARNQDICLTQIIAWNYVFAIILCYLFFTPDISAITTSSPWELYIPLMVLLPSVFLLLAASIRHMGIVKTDAAQRLSLFIPILAVWFIFKENMDIYKLTGLAIGFPAIMLILYKKQDNTSNGKWYLPALVLLGFGIIDILFKHVAQSKGLPYTTSLFLIFCGAFVLTFLAVIWGLLRKHYKLNIINLAFGALVGIFNFGNILFYLQAHKEFATSPSTVFAAMNMGVIVLGSITGIVIFREKLSRINYIGIVLALAAIVFITLSQLSNQPIKTH